MIAQVSRFDPWKDPLGVIAAYRLARQQVPVRSLLIRHNDPFWQSVCMLFRGDLGYQDVARLLGPLRFLPSILPATASETPTRSREVAPSGRWPTPRGPYLAAPWPP